MTITSIGYQSIVSLNPKMKEFPGIILMHDRCQQLTKYAYIDTFNTQREADFDS